MGSYYGNYVFDYEEALLLLALDSCAGWIVGLLLVVVGLVSARSALPRAGYLVGGAGALYLTRYCCVAFPSAIVRLDLIEDPHFLFSLSSACAVLLELGFTGLLSAGAIVLAREVKARRAEGGSA